MTQSYANTEVLEFYRKLPFNYYGSVQLAAASIMETNSVENYPVLIPLLKKPIRVLDVGCGAGWLVNAINYHYGRSGASATGLDYNAKALAQGQEIAKVLATSSQFVEADLFTYYPDEPFDLVTSVGVLHHTDNCIEGLRHIFDHCLTRGGHAFIGLYHKYGRAPFLEHFEELKSKGAGEDELLAEFKRLRPKGMDETHHLSWFYDQVLHPHETQHTLEEMIPVLRAHNMELVSTSINRFKAFQSVSDVLELEQSYFDLGMQRLREGTYFPGFFVFLAKKA